MSHTISLSNLIHWDMCVKFSAVARLSVDQRARLVVYNTRYTCFSFYCGHTDIEQEGFCNFEGLPCSSGLGHGGSILEAGVGFTGCNYSPITSLFHLVGQVKIRPLGPFNVQRGPCPEREKYCWCFRGIGGVGSCTRHSTRLCQWRETLRGSSRLSCSRQ